MAIFGWTVLGLVFLDELVAMAAMGVWGWHVGGSTATSGLYVVVLPLVTMLAWFWFASPKARYGGYWVRPIVKVVVFCLATAALWASGHHAWAVALLVFSVVVNALGQLPSIRVLAED